jgi:hypothetical protein
MSIIIVVSELAISSDALRRQPFQRHRDDRAGNCWSGAIRMVACQQFPTAFFARNARPKFGLPLLLAVGRHVSAKARAWQEKNPKNAIFIR